MLYKFKTANAGDVIMTGPVGDQVLRAAGREPAAQGIVEAAALPAAIAALEAAMAADGAADEAARQATGEADEAAAPRAISLRQRGWPLLEMLRRAQAAGDDVVWGV